MERKMETKDESLMEKACRRWRTSFSSVPAFTHRERNLGDCKQNARGQRGIRDLLTSRFRPGVLPLVPYIYIYI